MLLRDFQSLVLRQWGLIIICVLVTGALALLISSMITPVYASSALVQVTVLASDSSLTGSPASSPDELVYTEATLATGSPVLQAVASHYPGLTEAILAKEVLAVSRPNTELLEIDVQDTNSGRAANLANAIANTLIQQQITAMKQESASERESLQQDLDKTNDQIKALSSQMNALQTNDQAQMSVLQTQMNALEQHYNQWQTLLAQIQISRALNGSFLQIVQPAQPGYAPLRPDTPLNIGLGLLVGLCLGLSGAWLYTEVAVCEHTPDELKQMLQWPVIGTIWHAHAALRGTLVYAQMEASNPDAYRALDTNLRFFSLDGPLRTLVVTSTLADEGKSTIAANLALSMARDGKNIVLIDANLRHPTLQARFQIPADKPGLSNALLALSNASNAQDATGLPSTGSLEIAGPSIALESFCYTVGLPNLRIMPAGPLPPDPAALLHSRAMQDLITLLAGCGSDLVLFDTAQTSDFVDASILAAQADATLVIIDPALPTRMQIRRMKAALSHAGAHVVGCVFHTQQPVSQAASEDSSGQKTPQKQEVPVSSGLSRRAFHSPVPTSGSSLTNQVKGLVKTAFHDGNNPTK